MKVKKLYQAIQALTCAIEQMNQTLKNMPNSEVIKPTDIEQINESKNDISTQKERFSKSDEPLINTKSNHKFHIPQVITNWFRKYRLGFDHFSNPHTDTIKSRQTAYFMAMQYSSLAFFINLLNKMADGKKTLFLDLKNQPVEVISHSCFVANELNACGYLQFFNYKRSPICQLKLRSNGLPATRAYLRGQWFEQAIEQLLLEMENTTETLTWAQNIVIKTAQGQQKEIDFIITLNKEVYIVEATSGPWQPKATQILSLANILQLPIRRCLIVSPHAPDQQMTDFSTVHGCHVLSFTELREWLESTLTEKTKLNDDNILEADISSQIENSDIMELKSESI